jgi:hypothetical protein
MSISFLKASLEHFRITPPTTLAKVALLCTVPACASSSSLHWSVQPARCCRGRCFFTADALLLSFFLTDALPSSLLARILRRRCCFELPPHAHAVEGVLSLLTCVYFAASFSRWMFYHRGFISYVGSLALMYFSFAGPVYQTCGGECLPTVFLSVLLLFRLTTFSVVV